MGANGGKTLTAGGEEGKSQGTSLRKPRGAERTGT